MSANESDDKGKLIILKGDITNITKTDKPFIIPHVCNNIGAYNAGVAKSIRNKFPEAYDEYIRFNPKKMGKVNFVVIKRKKEDHAFIIANMIAQQGYEPTTDERYVNYSDLVSCMKKVRKLAQIFEYDIRTPMFGTGLSGGDWNIIKNLMIDCWCKRGIDVYVYKFDK